MSDSEVRNVSTPTIEQPLSQSSQPSVDPSSKKRKCTSHVWNHFTKIYDKGLPRAQCKHCKTSLSAKSTDGTSHLDKHIKNKHKNLLPMKGQMFLQVGDMNSDGTSDLRSHKFDQERSRKDLATMIILHEYPFSIVDHAGFREYSKNLQPLFKMVGRTTITNDCVKIFEEEKKKLYATFDQLQCRFSLTSDMWTSIQNKGYMSLTCHYIDDGWKLQKRIIAFIHVEAPHTALTISKVILERLYKWNIDRKIMSIALDNCSTNDAMVRDLKEKLNTKLVANGDFFHVRCSAHIINLIVQEAIDNIKHVISKVRESVKHVKSSTLRWQQFKEVASQVRAPCKNVVLDVRTRWNSTYEMLDTALEFKDAFLRLKEVDSSYVDAPNDEEWANAKVCCDNLKIFFDITNHISGALYPTANYFFTHICEIHLQLIDMCADSIPFVSEIGKKMMVKFSKYWEITSGILAVASVLDPRYKMISVDFYLKEIYGVDIGTKSEDICNLLKALYREYASKSSNAFYTPTHNDSTSGCTSTTCFPYTKRMEKFKKHVATKTTSVEMKDELEVYLEEPVVADRDGFDVLDWWRHVGVRFPIMQRLARDILCIPVSTVASESVFSTGGRVLDQYRSSLLPTTAEAIICTQDWLRNGFRGNLVILLTFHFSVLFFANLVSFTDKNINVNSINDCDDVEGLQSSNVLDEDQIIQVRFLIY